MHLNIETTLFHVYILLINTNLMHIILFLAKKIDDGAGGFYEFYALDIQCLCPGDVQCK